MSVAIYKLKYKLARIRHKYFIQNKGDTSCFRYPELKKYFKYFDSDLKNDIFQLKREKLSTLSSIALENYDIIQNIYDDTYFIFVFSTLGQNVKAKEKIEAYRTIKKEYKSHKFKKMLSKHYSKINFNSLIINEPFLEIKKYLNHSLEYNTYVLKIKNKKMRNIAVSMHGLNILYLDQETYNYGVGLIECIINNENGIKGRYLQNTQIEEIYALPKYKALLNIVDNPKFKNPDLFFAKGYLSLAFNEKDTIYNALYTLTEPFMKLLFSTIGMEELMDYVFLDKIDAIETRFNEIYPDCFNLIYTENNVFKRMDIIKDLALNQKINPLYYYKILFHPKKILNTYINNRVIAFIYLSKTINQNKKILFDLITNCYPWAVSNKTEITLTNWSKHVKLKYGIKEYQQMALEYQKYKPILDEL